MAKRVIKRVIQESTVVEGKDPYAEGKHIKNPEPNNGGGRASRPAQVQQVSPGVAQRHQVPNADQTEQEEVAASRTEPGA